MVRTGLGADEIASVDVEMARFCLPGTGRCRGLSTQPFSQVKPPFVECFEP